MPHHHDMRSDFRNISKQAIWGYTLINKIFMRGNHKKLINNLNLKGNEFVLDFGSGPGLVAKRIAQKLNENGKVTCLDISEPFLNKAKNTLKNFNNTKFILGDIREQNISNEKYDYITATYAIHDIEPDLRREIIETLSRILKKDGKICILEFDELVDGISFIDLFKEAGGLNGRIVSRNRTGILYEFTKN